MLGMEFYERFGVEVADRPRRVAARRGASRRGTMPGVCDTWAPASKPGVEILEGPFPKISDL